MGESRADTLESAARAAMVAEYSEARPVTQPQSRRLGIMLVLAALAAVIVFAIAR